MYINTTKKLEQSFVLNQKPDFEDIQKSNQEFHSTLDEFKKKLYSEKEKKDNNNDTSFSKSNTNNNNVRTSFNGSGGGGDSKKMFHDLEQSKKKLEKDLADSRKKVSSLMRSSSGLS